MGKLLHGPGRAHYEVFEGHASMIRCQLCKTALLLIESAQAHVHLTVPGSGPVCRDCQTLAAEIDADHAARGEEPDED